MNPHDVIPDFDRSAVVGPQINANQADSSPCGNAPPVELSAAQVAPHQDESGEWLEIEHPASNPGHTSPIVNRSPAGTRASGKASANITVAVAQQRAEEQWPLTLDEIIKQALVRLLRETSGNRRRTASMLGISRSTLYRMIARYGIDHVGRSALSPRSRIGPPVSPA